MSDHINDKCKDVELLNDGPKSKEIGYPVKPVDTPEEYNAGVVRTAFIFSHPIPSAKLLQRWREEAERPYRNDLPDYLL